MKLINTLLDALDNDVNLVIEIKDTLMYPAYLHATQNIQKTDEHIHLPDECIVVLKMKLRNYMKFMKALQSNGLNLKQRNEKDLVNDLVKWNK